MSVRILDGQALAARMREEIAPKVAAFTRRRGRPPGLAIVLVGHNPASEVYVRNKLKAAAMPAFAPISNGCRTPRRSTMCSRSSTG